MPLEISRNPHSYRGRGDLRARAEGYLLLYDRHNTVVSHLQHTFGQAQLKFFFDVVLGVGTHVLCKNDVCHAKVWISSLSASIESARKKGSDTAARALSGVVYCCETLSYSITFSGLIERVYDDEYLFQTCRCRRDQWYVLIFRTRTTAFLRFLIVQCSAWFEGQW